MLNGTERLPNKLECLIPTSAIEKKKKRRDIINWTDTCLPCAWMTVFIPHFPRIFAARGNCHSGLWVESPHRDLPLRPGSEGGQGEAKEGVKGTHKSVLVRDVVSELQLVKGDDFGHPLFAGGRAVRVDVHSLWHFRVSFAGYHPPGIMEFVPTIISRHNIHQ